MEGPMDGVKVLDLSEGYEGYTGQMLAEFGASAIKVEPLQGDYIRQLGPPFIQGESAAFMGVNRGKRSLALAWKENPEARRILNRLIAQTDVIITTLYADEAEKLDITYEAVRQLNPKVVYCSITPMGDVGPYANYRASDLEVQSMFGHWRYLGGSKFPADPNEWPLRLGVPVAALNSAVFAHQGITAALISRLRTGIGQKVMVSEAGSIIAMRNIQFAAESEPDEYEGHNVGHMRPPFHGTPTKDRTIYWGFSGADASLPEFLKAMGLGDDPRFKGSNVRLEMQGDAKKIIDGKFKEMPAEEAMALIRRYGGSAVYWNTFETMSQDSQALAMDMVAEFQHATAGKIKTMGLPWWFSDTPPSVGTPPLLGQHSREVLQESGLSQEEVQALFRAGLIAEPAG